MSFVTKMLSKSMGAPTAYEYRHKELQELQTQPSSKGEYPPPTETWRSFTDMVHPQHGLLTRYMELGQLAVLVGDVLFVHGAVHEHNMG